MSTKFYGMDAATTILMSTATVTIALGIMNLILTVIVERATESREKDTREVARQKSANQAAEKQNLFKICQRMDKDGNGLLSLDELLTGFERSEEFRSLMTSMEMTEDELQAIFRIADDSGTGEIEYSTFCNELFRLRPQDQRAAIAVLRISLHETQQMIKGCIEAKLERLTSQGDMCLAQVALLDTKIQQIAPFPFRAQLSQPSDSHEFTETTANDIDRMLFPDHTHDLALQTADLQAWRDLEQLEREKEVLMKTAEHVVTRAMDQVDMSVPNLMNSVLNVANGAGRDIKTLEVWLAERRYQIYKSSLHSLSQVEHSQGTKRQFAEQQGIPTDIESGEYIVSARKQLSRIRELLPQLVQISASTEDSLGDLCCQSRMENVMSV